MSLVRSDRVLSVNTIVNPGFEVVIPGTDQPFGWRADYFDANVGSTIGVNNTLSHSGDFSARLDISQNQTAVSTGTPITFGELRLAQLFPQNLRVSNLTSRDAGLRFWFNIQPKFSGFTLIVVRIKATDTTELDYAFANPTIGIVFPNSTDGGEGGRPVKAIFLPLPNLNQWNNLARNLRQDWLSPITLSNGTTVSGFYHDDQTLYWIEFDAFFLKDPFSGATYGETVWIDDVSVYINIPQHGRGPDSECPTIESGPSKIEFVPDSENCSAS